jgi:hypothetical protein
MEAPRIQTAIPRHRFRLGGYQAVLLEDIESPDNVRYRYILALVREGEARPSVYVTCEKNPRSRARDGAYRMRLITEVFNEEIESSDAWAEAQAFAADALKLAARTLGLGDEEPIQEG